MDVAWAEQHLDAPAAELQHKLLRARQTLAAAIDLKRRLIEELRPTLLDNVGLFAALRWHVEGICARAALPAASFCPRTNGDLHRIHPSIYFGSSRKHSPSLPRASAWPRLTLP